MGKINICIVHYNTPKLTECLVRSINKFVPESTIYIFDNSDIYPFTYRQENIVYFDNTNGQIINFDDWLKKYPRRTGVCYSAKHCFTIQKCMDLIGDCFILLDSDVLLKKDITELYDKNFAFCGEILKERQIGRLTRAARISPFICFLNPEKLKEHNVTYFDDSHMQDLHVAYPNMVYDTGCMLYLNKEKLPNKIIKNDDYIVHFGGGSYNDAIFLRQKKSNDKNASINAFLNINRRLYSDEKNNKVIYTCITGSYELLDDPFVLSDGYDYICFTNYDKIKSSIWEIRPIPKELDGLSEVKKQRCIKINPHKYLPEYEFSIWVDGSIKLKKDVNEYVKENCNDAHIFIPIHPNRKCIYDEMNACIRIKKDTEETIEKQRSKYKNEQFPKNYGLVQSNIIMRYHNEPDCIRLMEAWWQEVKNGSHRDQLSFDYARWKNNDVKFKFLDKNTCKSSYFWWDQTHGKNLTKKIINSPFKVLDIELKQKEEKIVKLPASSNTHSIRRSLPSKRLRKFLET